MGGATHAHAQPAEPDQAAVRKRVQQAFQEGNAGQLLTPAAERIEVSLLGMQTYFSRAQALYVLQDFFKNYTPRTFVVREASTADDNYFVIGEYAYGQSEQPLQVYVRLSLHEEAWVLQEVRIDRPPR